MKYIKLSSRDAISGLMEMKSRGGDLALVVYDTQRGRVECAPMVCDPRNIDAKFRLDATALNQIKADARQKFNGNIHAILCYNLSNDVVAMLDAVPELAVAASALVSIVAPLMGAQIAPQPMRGVAPSPRHWDERGCGCDDEDDDPWDDKGDSPSFGEDVDGIIDTYSDPLQGINPIGLGKFKF